MSTKELRNKIFLVGELDKYSVCRDFRHTAKDGKEYATKYYYLRAFKLNE